jgi:hypothetical protein
MKTIALGRGTIPLAFTPSIKSLAIPTVPTDMRIRRPSRLLLLAGVATLGYLAAFTTAAAGALFAVLITIGIVGELGFWAELIGRWRRRTGDGTSTS